MRKIGHSSYEMGATFTLAFRNLAKRLSLVELFDRMEKRGEEMREEEEEGNSLRR